jgi:glycosyltransferase involved in cell wall biosynthesis
MNYGLVSCIIPTYKRSDSLIEAINSALNQTYKNIEVIVVDDNEPNDEHSINVQRRLSCIKDNRLRYIQQEKHCNGAVARNIGIAKALGEYIAFLDDDDEWLPTKIEKQLSYLSKFDDSYGAVSCLVNIVTQRKVVRKTAPYSGGDLHKSILNRSISIYTPTIVFKKTYLDDAGYFDERLVRHQDVQLFLDFSNKYKIAVLNEHLVDVKTDNTSNAPDIDKLIQVKEQFFRAIDNHLGKYNEKEKKRIKAAHDMEVVLVALREKRVKVAIRYIKRIGLNITPYLDLINRVKNRNKKS